MNDLASDLVQKMPAVALAGLVASLTASPAMALDFAPPPEVQQQQAQAPVAAFESQTAPDVKANESGLPEGNQWRYSEFINAGALYDSSRRSFHMRVIWYALHRLLV